MCLGIPGKVIEIYDVDGTLMSKVDFNGVVQEVCLATTPEAEIGQFVLVHAGFSLNVFSDQEATETLKILKELEAFNKEYFGEDASLS